MSNSSNNNGTNNTLSPFDISGIGMGFGLYRPRRPSYTFATQHSRQRSESYRYAIRRENADSASEVSNGEDFIEGVLRNKARKVSYLKATKAQEEQPSPPRVGVVMCDENVSPATIDLENDAEVHRDDSEQASEEDEKVTVTIAMNNHSPAILHHSGDDNTICESHNYINHKSATHRKVAMNNTFTPHSRQDSQEQSVAKRTPNHRGDGGGNTQAIMSACSLNKNLIMLCSAFILVFSSFRAIQNLQSSMHAQDNLGILTMMTVHVSMIFACLLAPIIINVFTAKWALCIGILCFLIWFGAHFHPTFYTLIPTSIFVGFGQGILWNAESSYILKLAFDSSRVSRGQLDREMFRFHGIFLACFQTTHIWGNLISSLLLSERANEISDGHDSSAVPEPQPVADNDAFVDVANFSYADLDYPVPEGDTVMPNTCGALHRCTGATVTLFPFPHDRKALAPVIWKLMTSYIVLGVVSFGIIIIFLDRIGARSDPDRNPKQLIFQHLSQLFTHKTLRLLTPLLLFNGMQQGFIYSDYNQYYVTCNLGINYVGYCMITLGGSNVMGAIFVAVFSHKIPREVVLGFGGIVHIALMIGYLIWIPENNPVLYFVLAGAWGVCDSVWQTQCNTLICLTCTEAPEVAFTNHRLVQSIGLAIMFGCGTWMCVSAKLYMLMTLLVVAIMFYVLAEYRLRHDDDEVFEDP